MSDEARRAHAETLKVFACVEGSTSPREAAKQAADYMLEVLLAAAPVPCAASPADNAIELAMVKAQLRGMQDFLSGQPREMPFDGSEVSAAKNSQLNFAWTLGYDIASESELFKVMVGRADRATARSQALANDLAKYEPVPRATGEGARDEQQPADVSVLRSADSATEQDEPAEDANCSADAGRRAHDHSDQVAVSRDPHRLPTNDDMPPGNWHAIEGPNGMCACGPVEGCPERLQRFIRSAVDFWYAKATFLERERERALAELPDAFARASGSLALKVRRYREFVTPYVDAELARLRGEAAVRPRERGGHHPGCRWDAEGQRYVCVEGCAIQRINDLAAVRPMENSHD